LLVYTCCGTVCLHEQYRNYYYYYYYYYYYLQYIHLHVLYFECSLKCPVYHDASIDLARNATSETCDKDDDVTPVTTSA